jgi:hypothetical protein
MGVSIASVKAGLLAGDILRWWFVAVEEVGLGKGKGIGGGRLYK